MHSYLHRSFSSLSLRSVFLLLTPTTYALYITLFYFSLHPDSTHFRLHAMPGSHIHNAYAPSTPTNPFVAAPRRPKGIGPTGDLSAAYDTGVVSDADGPIIGKVHSNTSQPVRCAGSIAVQVASAVTQNVKSFEGQVDVHANHQNGAYGKKTLVLPISGAQNNQGHGSSHYIPNHSISPANDLRLTSKPQKPRLSDINPQADYPQPVSIQSHNQPYVAITHLSPMPRLQLLSASSHYPLSFSQPRHHPSLRSSLLPLKDIAPSPLSFLVPSISRIVILLLPPLRPRHILPHARASSASESIKGSTFKRRKRRSLGREKKN